MARLNAAGARRLLRGTLAWTAVAGVMAALALAFPVDHDEGQYVAGAALAAGGMPFRDFLYIQTPLQAWLFAPFVGLFAGHAFVTLRIVTGLLGAGVLGAVYAAQRSLGVSPGRAALCTALLAGCYSFQFGSGVVRNDALPALLYAAGMLCALAAVGGSRGSRWLWGVTGLLLGAATSAKISYAVPLAAAGLFVFVAAGRGRAPVAALAGLVGGTALGLVPCVLAWRAAPDNFIYGVFTYPTTAPFAWSQLRGDTWRLAVGGKLFDTLFALVRGPAFGALLVVVAAMIHRWRNRIRPRLDIAPLDWLIFAGVAAALAPTPTYPQYVLPLLPPLFVRLGIEVQKLRAIPRGLPLVAAGVVAVGALVGLGHHAWIVGGAAKNGLPALEVTRQSHWVGDRLRAAGASGPVATLSPYFVPDTGYPLDPRFATGPFAYRTANALSEPELRRMSSVSPHTLVGFLDERPPAAILVGYEGSDSPSDFDLDGPLRVYALARGYRRELSPLGRLELYIAPR